MQIITTYRRSFATLLLAFFLLSMMPVKVLHSLFANHSDYTTTLKNNTLQTTIAASGIDCHCNSNVVTTSFYAAINNFTAIDAPSWPPSDLTKKPTYAHIIVSHNDLRGPPPLI